VVLLRGDCPFVLPSPLRVFHDGRGDGALGLQQALLEELPGLSDLLLAQLPLEVGDSEAQATDPADALEQPPAQLVRAQGLHAVTEPHRVMSWCGVSGEAWPVQP
jgi:hypothetical protein